MTTRRLLLALSAACALALGIAASSGGVSGSQPVEAPAEPGDGYAGEAVFRTYCAMCHGEDASGMMGMHPSLRGAIDRLSRQGVEVAIREGRRTQPPMPAWEGRLTDVQIDDVIAYIASLPEGPRNFGPGDGSGMMVGDANDGGVSLPIAVLIVVTAGVLGAGARALHRSATSPRRLLDRRYATGELSRDEYLQRRSDLQPD